MLVIHATPITLIVTCASAARLAFLDAPSEARQAVIVVPIFSPRTSAAPASKLIIPVPTRPNVIPTVADEDCTSAVTIAPTRQQRKTPK